MRTASELTETLSTTTTEPSSSPVEVALRVAVEPIIDETGFDASGQDLETNSDSDEQTPERSVDSILYELLDSNPNIDMPYAMKALKSAGLTATGRHVEKSCVNSNSR